MNNQINKYKMELNSVKLRLKIINSKISSANKDVDMMIKSKSNIRDVGNVENYINYLKQKIDALTVSEFTLSLVIDTETK